MNLEEINKKLDQVRSDLDYAEEKGNPEQISACYQLIKELIEKRGRILDKFRKRNEETGPWPRWDIPWKG